MDKIITLGEKPVKVLKFFDPSEVHISAYLTNISKMYRNNSMIFDLLFPDQTVVKINDSVPVYGAEHLQEVSTLRKPKTESNGVVRHLGTAITYNCAGHALHDDIGPDERANADPPILADISTTEFITQLLDLAKEFSAYTLISTTSGYASASHYRTLTTAECWDNFDSADSNPLDDIDVGKKQIWSARGKRANVIMIPYLVGMALSRHPALLELVKYTDPNLLTTSGLPPVIRGLKVIEADAIKNTANQGQTASLSGLWSDYVWIGYINPKMGLKDTTWGLTFNRGGRIVRQWFEQKRNCDRIEVEDQGYDMKIFDNACGYLIINALK